MPLQRPIWVQQPDGSYKEGWEAVESVWIYTNTSKQVGDVDHLKVFATSEAANAWIALRDPEGVAFEYPVIASPPSAEHR